MVLSSSFHDRSRNSRRVSRLSGLNKTMITSTKTQPVGVVGSPVVVLRQIGLIDTWSGSVNPTRDT